MFNLPEGIGKELDDEMVLCEVCGHKEDVNDGEYVDGEFVCNDCIKFSFIKTEDGFIKISEYSDWKTNKLRELVKELVEVYQVYFSPDGNSSLLNDAKEIRDDIEKLDMKVWNFMDDANYFFLKKNNTTLEQLYHVIDYLCGTELEIK